MNLVRFLFASHKSSLFERTKIQEENDYSLPFTRKLQFVELSARIIRRFSYYLPGWVYRDREA